MASLTLRIYVLDPPAGLLYSLQSGKGAAATRLAEQRSDQGTLVFQIEVDAIQGKVQGTTNCKGPFTQGPPSTRFFYLGVTRPDGSGAGRVKVPLDGIRWTDAETAIAEQQVLEASFNGTSERGGPALATVPLTGEGWIPAPA